MIARASGPCPLPDAIIEGGGAFSAAMFGCRIFERPAGVEDILFEDASGAAPFAFGF